MSDETIEFVRELEGGDSEIGEAISTFATLAKRMTQKSAAEEYTLLFYGMGAGGELLPYASHYLTGFLHERPLADIRRALSELGVERAEGNTEPEDHAAFLCEVMHGLIIGTWGEPADLCTQRAFFEIHLAPWIERFFADMEKAQSAMLYMPLGTIGRLFMAVESDAFSMVGAGRS